MSCEIWLDNYSKFKRALRSAWTMRWIAHVPVPTKLQRAFFCAGIYWNSYYSPNPCSLKQEQEFYRFICTHFGDWQSLSTSVCNSWPSFFIFQLSLNQEMTAIFQFWLFFNCFGSFRQRFLVNLCQTFSMIVFRFESYLSSTISSTQLQYALIF